MAGTADSSAWGGTDVLHHHKIVAAILQGQLSDPSTESLRWLDLACGRGKIFNGIEKMETAAKAKIDYFGYELNNDYARETEQLAESLGVRGKVYVGDLSHFTKYYGPDERFHLITLTNTVHEVGPGLLPSIIVAALARLEDAGCLYVYDMEEIRPPELGAVPWTQVDACKILESLYSALGLDKRRRPYVTPWRHRTCDGWDFQIHRNHLNVSQAELAGRQEVAVMETGQSIRLLLEMKRDDSRAELEQLTMYGCNPKPTTEEDERRCGEKKLQLLYNYWAVVRALTASPAPSLPPHEQDGSAAPHRVPLHPQVVDGEER